MLKANVYVSVCRCWLYEWAWSIVQC